MKEWIELKIIEISKEELDSLYITEVLSGFNIVEMSYDIYSMQDGDKFNAYIDYSKVNFSIEQIINSFKARERIFKYNSMNIYLSGLTEQERDICISTLGHENYIRLKEGVDLDVNNRN